MIIGRIRCFFFFSSKYQRIYIGSILEAYSKNFSSPIFFFEKVNIPRDYIFFQKGNAKSKFQETKKVYFMIFEMTIKRMDRSRSKLESKCANNLIIDKYLWTRKMRNWSIVMRYIECLPMFSFSFRSRISYSALLLAAKDNRKGIMVRFLSG